MNGSTINNLDAGDYCIASMKRPVMGCPSIVGERFHGGQGADNERADWETTYYPDIVLKGKNQ